MKPYHLVKKLSNRTMEGHRKKFSAGNIEP
nr:MAG TPA: hypothetical protein [Caudoviricetes sp.]